MVKIFNPFVKEKENERGKNMGRRSGHSDL